MQKMNVKELSTAMLVHAHYLDIDLETERRFFSHTIPAPQGRARGSNGGAQLPLHLIPIARDALRTLPPGWELGVIDEGKHAGIPYFYNLATGQSVWTHPHEEAWRKRVQEARGTPSG